MRLAIEEIEALCRQAADAAALNAVTVLADWVAQQGYPQLAQEMRDAWIVTTPDAGGGADKKDGPA